MGQTPTITITILILIRIKAIQVSPATECEAVASQTTKPRQSIVAASIAKIFSPTAKTPPIKSETNQIPRALRSPSTNRPSKLLKYKIYT
jgi:hypothetical protein